MIILSCDDTSSTASLSLLLSSRDFYLQIQLSDINTIGALRISLPESGQQMENDISDAIHQSPKRG